MIRHIDARGLSCPEPLILATRALRGPGPFEIVVDNPVARENIVRMLADRYGLAAAVRESGREIAIRVER
jgi:TusA-related sulfurtransferase